MMKVFTLIILYNIMKISADKYCRETPNGTEYRGHLAMTHSGLMCQHWNKQFPHKHSFKKAVPKRSRNYCRNPDSRERPWCYTMNPEIETEFCDIPRCTKECRTSLSGKEYRGSVRMTYQGLACQRWNKQSPQKHPYRKKVPKRSRNYCRNPDDGNKPWCYTRNPLVKAQYCDIPKCTTDCRKTFAGKEYKGTHSVTETNRKCQDWAAQTPHKHSYPLEPHNYCRNSVANMTMPFCLTMDKDVKIEYCDIPKCE